MPCLLSRKGFFSVFCFALLLFFQQFHIEFEADIGQGNYVYITLSIESVISLQLQLSHYLHAHASKRLLFLVSQCIFNTPSDVSGKVMLIVCSYEENSMYLFAYQIYLVSVLTLLLGYKQQILDYSKVSKRCLTLQGCLLSPRKSRHNSGVLN